MKKPVLERKDRAYWLTVLAEQNEFAEKLDADIASLEESIAKAKTALADIQENRTIVRSNQKLAKRMTQKTFDYAEGCKLLAKIWGEILPPETNYPDKQEYYFSTFSKLEYERIQGAISTVHGKYSYREDTNSFELWFELTPDELTDIQSIKL